MNPRTVLQERYPLADFFEYFRFLGECAGTVYDCAHTQQHHICPRAQFPEYEFGFPENVITLTVEEHYWAHKLLEAACGIKAISPALFAAQAEGASKGGPIAARISKENGTAIFAPGMQAKGGRISGRKHKENGTGFFAPGMAAKGGRIGGRIQGLKNAENGHLDTLPHIRWHVRRGIKSPTCELCHV